MKKLLWILAPAGLVAAAALLETPGCADTADICALNGGCPGSNGGGGSDGGTDGNGGAGGSDAGDAGDSGMEGGDGGIVICQGRRDGDDQAQQARSVAVAGSGDVVVAGSFQNHIDFGMGALSATM